MTTLKQGPSLYSREEISWKLVSIIENVLAAVGIVAIAIVWYKKTRKG
jgi:hypothetical protein